jgi:hypothetical protein
MAAKLTEFLKGIQPLRTAYTGGGAGALDALVVTSVHAGMLAFVRSGTNVTAHHLRAGTDAESSPGIVRPDNYATTTNEFVWEKLTFA